MLKANKFGSRLVVITALLIALLLAVLAFAYALKTNGTPRGIEAVPISPGPTATSNNTTEALPVSVSPTLPDEDMAKLPVFPNALPMDLPPNQQVPGALAFSISAYSGDVLTYYQTELPKKGWSLYDTYAPISLEYTWEDANLALPYLLHLALYAQDDVVSPQPKDTILYLHLWREPDPNNISVLDDAHNLQTHDAVAEDIELGSTIRTDERIITYLTGHSIEEAVSYYEMLLPKNGWLKTSSLHPPPPSLSDGTTYYYSSTAHTGGCCRQFGATVNIVAKTDLSGQTSVELRIRGTRLRN